MVQTHLTNQSSINPLIESIETLSAFGDLSCEDSSMKIVKRKLSSGF